MLGTLTPEQKKDWKSHVPALAHAYNCTRNAATGFSPYFLLFGREPRLPVDVEFGPQNSFTELVLDNINELTYIYIISRVK